MAKFVVARNQQEEMARRHPKPVYSRRVCLDLKADKGSGQADMQVTPPLGNRLWLLSIDIWFMNYTIDVVTQGWIVISTGGGKKPTAQDVVYNWDNLLPVIGTKKPWFQWFGIRGERHYSMMRFFEGTERRFGAYIENKQNNIDWYAHVSFEISEG